MSTRGPPLTCAASGAGPLIIAHRGGSLEAPENTVGSIVHAVHAGSDWQEIDVQLSRDGQAVVLHDDRLERTTSGSGRVAKRDLADLLALAADRPAFDAGIRDALHPWQIPTPSFPGIYTGERVPSLRQVLAVPGARLMVEHVASPVWTWTIYGAPEAATLADLRGARHHHRRPSVGVQKL